MNKKAILIKDLLKCDIPHMKDFFDQYVDVEFEGHTFKAIKNYDEWLKTCYGNYMEFPPEEQRISIHGIKAFYKTNVINDNSWR